MKTLAIATVVGTIILYIYLALAHELLHFHDSDFKYTAAQDNIMQVLNNSNLEEGYYFLPNVPPGTSMKEQEEHMKQATGKPGALINYYPVLEGLEASLFIMSFIYNLIAVLILCIALAAASSRLTSFGQRLWFVMLFPIFVIFSEIMLQYNWVGIPMHYIKGLVIDQVVGFLLVGLWLAWYYGRVEARKTATA